MRNRWSLRLALAIGAVLLAAALVFAVVRSTGRNAPSTALAAWLPDTSGSAPEGIPPVLTSLRDMG